MGAVSHDCCSLFLSFLHLKACLSSLSEVILMVVYVGAAVVDAAEVPQSTVVV